MGAVVSLQRRGAPRIQDGRRAFDMLPTGKGRSGRYFYALGYTDGRTKIGIARDPRSRLRHHWVTAQGGIVWAHVFSTVPWNQAEAIERRVMRLAGEVSERIGRTETFRGLSRADALRCVRAVLTKAEAV